MTRRFVALCLNLITITMSPGAFAEVHKCLGKDEKPVYQDTPCRDPADEQAIDTRFANSLPLRFPDEDARIIREIAHEQRQEEQQRVDARDRRINRTIRQHEAKQARCRELTRRYNDLQDRQRRIGTRDPQGESELIRRMRDACSA